MDESRERELREREEMLNALLFDTKRHEESVGHKLLSRFHSLRTLVAADEEALTHEEGVGKARARIIKSIPRIAELFLLDELVGEDVYYNKENVLRYLTVAMRDLRFEVFKVIPIDVKGRVITVCDMFKGSITSGTIYPRDVVDRAMKWNASALVVAHNHPSRDAAPSEDDCRVTRVLFIALEAVGITLLDHLIIAGNTHYSFHDEGMLDGISEDYYLVADSAAQQEPRAHARLPD